jgi:hypothetical protein
MPAPFGKNQNHSDDGKSARRSNNDIDHAVVASAIKLDCMIRRLWAARGPPSDR